MMAEYINREAAINEIHRFRGYLDEDMEYRMKIAFNRLPADDVAEVVRCKDCRYSYYADNRVPEEQRLVCSLICGDFGENDFCSYGMRKEKE